MRRMCEVLKLVYDCRAIVGNFFVLFVLLSYMFACLAEVRVGLPARMWGSVCAGALVWPTFTSCFERNFQLLFRNSLPSDYEYGSGTVPEHLLFNKRNQALIQLVCISG
jgi:hypothetical protein